MKATINPDQLAIALRKAERVIAQKNLIAILDNFLVDVHEDKVIITASDNDVTLSLITPLITTDTPFSFCVNAKKFAQAIYSLHDTMDIEIIKNELVCKHKKGKFSMSTFDAEEYPSQQPTDVNKEFTIPSNDLSQLLYNVSYACSQDDLRPMLKGVFLDIQSDKVTSVATDAHKLVKSDYDYNNSGEPFSLIVPQKAALVIAPLIEDTDAVIHCQMFDGSAVFAIEDTFRISFRMILAKYPNYNSVFPQGTNNVAIVNRQELQESIQRALLFANSKVGLAVLTFTPDKITITTQDIDYSRNSEEAFGCNHEGEDIKIGFNGMDLLAILNNLKKCDEVVFHMIDKAHAAVITPNATTDKTVALLMPMMYE